MGNSLINQCIIFIRQSFQVIYDVLVYIYIKLFFNVKSFDTLKTLLVGSNRFEPSLCKKYGIYIYWC